MIAWCSKSLALTLYIYGFSAWRRPPGKSRQSQSSEELDIDGDLKSFDLDAESEGALDNNDLRAEIKRLKGKNNLLHII